MVKRFITYLYEYERGNKTKNVGFVKVDVRNKKVNMEICIRNVIRTMDAGKIYAIVKENLYKGILLGEIDVVEGQGNIRLNFSQDDIMGSDFSIVDIIGVGIKFVDGIYFASCWREAEEEAVGRGELFIEKEEEMQSSEIMEPETLEEEFEAESIEQMQMVVPSDMGTTYRKMELEQLRTLPSPNWHLCNNSFLVHGFWNYGYLVLKKEVEEDTEKSYLGVPGIFETPEMVMAVVFGFTQFEEIPEEMIEEELRIDRTFPKIEKNQEPKNGVFGCWFVELQE